MKIVCMDWFPNVVVRESESTEMKGLSEAANVSGQRAGKPGA
jgi:hypothetical protein